MGKITFESADRIFWHDRLLAATVLKLIPNWVYPNYITVFRFLATPMVAILMASENYKAGLVAFLIVAATDAIDGALARTRNQITEWGKLYDPVADKILIGFMVFIIVLRYIDYWTALLIMVIEAIIIATGYIRKRMGRVVQANIWGKVKMILQVTGVVVLLLAVIFNVERLMPFAHGTFYLAIVFAIVSLFTYGF
jgi:CDP-diacylglycerol--glycerol-3-phosphate 3-phosphatidyltransferase